MNKPAYELAHHIELLLVNSQIDFPDSFENRNDLTIAGSQAGMVLFAEYLLNLALDSSVTNYINFDQNPFDGIDIKVAEDSCSGRIEITNAS